MNKQRITLCSDFELKEKSFGKFVKEELPDNLKDTFSETQFSALGYIFCLILTYNFSFIILFKMYFVFRLTLSYFLILLLFLIINLLITAVMLYKISFAKKFWKQQYQLSIHYLQKMNVQILHSTAYLYQYDFESIVVESPVMNYAEAQQLTHEKSGDCFLIFWLGERIVGYLNIEQFLTEENRAWVTWVTERKDDYSHETN